MHVQAFSGRLLNGLLVVTITGLITTDSARAGSTVLGDSGWEARWDPSLNNRVDIDFIDVVDNVIFIQKSADFTDAAVDGIHSPIKITFNQIGDSAVTHIVIDDEIIDNNTGTAWTGFMMKLKNGDGTNFNPNRTLDSGGGGPIGFSIDPFTTASFSNSNKQLDISGGVVANGDTWFPGGSANDGQLWINVDSGGEGNFGSFTLKERPVSEVIPGSPALLSLIIGGLTCARGRRRRN